jgi:G:T-mismatch repair DNA endonuclease (very short patch repair protein)
MEKYGEDNPLKSSAIKSKIKETCLAKFGVENPQQSQNVRAKTMQTCIDRYGVKSPFLSDVCKEKAKETCLERYGVEHPSQSEIVIEKKKKFNLEKYGVEYHIAAKSVREKSLQTLSENFGVDNPMRSNEVKRRYKETLVANYGEGIVNPSQLEATQKKIKETSFARYGVKHFTKSELIKYKQRKTMVENHGYDNVFKLPSTRIACHTKEAHKKRIETMKSAGANFQSSKVEDRLFEILTVSFAKVHRHVEINGWDIDFYIEDIDAYINMNGVYWHGRDMSHKQLEESVTKQSKTILGTKLRDELREKWFLENKKKLVIIWEDELESAIQKIAR